MDRILLNNVFTDEETNALRELKSTLSGLLGNNLVKLVLYGSRARGDKEGIFESKAAHILQSS